MNKQISAVARFWNRPVECWKNGCKSCSNLEVAHIIAKSLGGSNKPENLVILCKHHHNLAPDVNDKEYMWEWIKDDHFTNVIGSEFFDIVFKDREKQTPLLLEKWKNIMNDDSFKDWYIKNIAQHGLSQPTYEKQLNNINWIVRKWKPFKELLNVV